ncbi:uncharacterized protein BJ212DRAFT_1486396 [Suillus subaureus]|uniref:Uncharacterized protein n=1 Tax=Suillus subaureus TaxID=48587 RepID=A0A9P7J6S2_9AGAM|nr:uncharacterized protein BJ212DRAFT_1486396 [Suillus subaureus]KAG1805475.1 hypothetical protein BJ212DRAFT_1486396 [Suillus subaureus]
MDSPFTFNYTQEQLGASSSLQVQDIGIIRGATLHHQACQHLSEDSAQSDPPGFNHKRTLTSNMSSLAPNVAGCYHASPILPASPAPPQSSNLSSLTLNIAHSRQASPFPLAPAAPTQSNNASSLTLNVACSCHASPFLPAPAQLPDLFYGSSMSHQAAWMEQNLSLALTPMACWKVTPWVT